MASEERRETPEEAAAWKAALFYHPHVALDLTVTSLEFILARANERGIYPTRLVVGPSDLFNINTWFEPRVERQPEEGAVEQIVVPIAESIRVSRESRRDIILAVVVGDFVDDGRWYLEDGQGRKCGSS
jgi:hypothetical protein